MLILRCILYICCCFYMIDCVHTPYIYYLSQFGDQWINLLSQFGDQWINLLSQSGDQLNNLLTNEKGPLYIEK